MRGMAVTPPVPVLVPMPQDVPSRLIQPSSVNAAAFRPEAGPMETLSSLPSKFSEMPLEAPTHASVVHTSPSLHSALVVHVELTTFWQLPPEQVSVVFAWPSLQSAFAVQQPAVGA